MHRRSWPCWRRRRRSGGTVRRQLRSAGHDGSGAGRAHAGARPISSNSRRKSPRLRRCR
jgi:hypothetical protein